MTDNVDADTVNRTVLLRMHNHQAATIEDAVEAHNNTRVAIAIDSETASTREGQAALLTAVKTGTRAFGTVHVIVDNGLTVLGGPSQGEPLTDTIVAEDATIHANIDEVDSDAPAILIGAANAGRTSRPVIRATWDGWTAAITPGKEGSVKPSGNVLAAIAAGALAINEAFDLEHFPATTAAYERALRLNLWHTIDSTETDSPNLEWAPPAWWLIGLGHLGQAYTWVISWLNYADPGAVNIILQDTGRTAIANHSTGILTPRNNEGRRKTRQAAAALEAAGYTNTNIIERRLDVHTRVTDDEKYHVAVIGVDDTEPRRLLSNAGWAYVVDAGLGTGVNDFDSISIHTLTPDDNSATITSWQGRSAPITVPDSPAFTDLTNRFDQCGVIEVAGKAIGASFVGSLAAVLAIAEPIKVLHGGRPVDRLKYDPRRPDIVSSARHEDTSSHVLAAPLNG